MSSVYIPNEVIKVGPAALYEQLAEECSELAHASLKVARKWRGENPTPVELEEALDHLREEFSDVTLMAYILDLEADSEIMQWKVDRWVDRIKEANDD